MTFDDFCKRRFFDKRRVEEFRTWLGDRANQDLSEFDWTELWTEFLRSKLDKVPA